MARSKDANLKFLRDRFTGKTATIILDLQGNGDAFVGCKVKLGEMTWDGARTQFKGYIVEVPTENPHGIRVGTDYWLYTLEFELEPDGIPMQKVTGLEKRVKTIEEIDRYGNDYIIELYEEGEKVIYLSSALRTLLGIKDKDKVGFALDKKAKNYYIYKEDDESIGHEVIDGKIDNNVEWRNLYNTFNPETQHPSKGKLKFHISHYVEKNSEFPELTFYLINEKWYEKKVEMPFEKVRRGSVKKPSNLQTEPTGPAVGSPEWVRAQMEAEVNRQRGFTGGRVGIPTFESRSMWDTVVTEITTPPNT